MEGPNVWKNDVPFVGWGLSASMRQMATENSERSLRESHHVRCEGLLTHEQLRRAVQVQAVVQCSCYQAERDSSDAPGERATETQISFVDSCGRGQESGPAKASSSSRAASSSQPTFPWEQAGRRPPKHECPKVPTFTDAGEKLRFPCPTCSCSHRVSRLSHLRNTSELRLIRYSKKA